MQPGTYPSPGKNLHSAIPLLPFMHIALVFKGQDTLPLVHCIEDPEEELEDVEDPPELDELELLEELPPLELVELTHVASSG